MVILNSLQKKSQKDGFGKFTNLKNKKYEKTRNCFKIYKTMKPKNNKKISMIKVIINIKIEKSLRITSNEFGMNI